MSESVDPIDAAVQVALNQQLSVRNYEIFLQRLISQASCAMCGVQGEEVVEAYLRGVSNTIRKPIQVHPKQ